MHWQKFSSVFGGHIMVVEFFLPKSNGPFVFFKTFHIFFSPFPCEIKEEEKVLLVLSVVKSTGRDLNSVQLCITYCNSGKLQFLEIGGYLCVQLLQEF
jgi:hypothetical protein